MSRYIDADLLKDKTTRVNNIWNCTTNAEGKGLDEIIDDIPTADVRENVRGEWIKRIDHLDYGLIEFEGFECSLCGVKIWKDDYENIEFKFCPNCGAKMKNEE